MRILLLNVTYNQGSTGKIVHDLYTYLKNQDHEVVVCYGRGKKVDNPSIYKVSNNLEVYMHALLTRLTGLTGYFSWFSTAKFLRIIRRFKPDVVHIHNLHGYYINILPVINYLKHQSIKCVWTLHDEYLYTGKCGYSYECRNWENQCGKCPYRRDYPASLFFDRTKKMLLDKKKAFDGFEKLVIVTPSQWLAERAKQSILGNKSISVIQNGIDTEIFKPYSTIALRKQYHLRDEEKVILHVTNSFDEVRKGGKYVLELARRLPNIKFFIVGDQKKIEALPQNVISVGRIENQIELAKYYSMADMLVITSKAENFPTVCIEAICCGTPVIGFQGGGTAETAPDGYSMFVSFGDMEKLKNAAMIALQGGLKEKKACKDWGEGMYDKASIAKKYLQLYFE